MENIHNINGIIPKVKLSDGQTIVAGSKSSSSTYTIKQIDDDHYSCTCMAWKMKKGMPVDARTCKHLEEVLGKEYEQARLAIKGVDAIAAPVTSKKRKKAGDQDDDNAGHNNASKRKVNPEFASISSTARGKADVEVLLAQTYKLDKMIPDCTKFWVSEKLDGIRFLQVYDGKGKMFSRLGNEFTPPKEYMDLLPKGDTLDGELFIRRNAFSETSSIVRSHASKKWPKVTMMIFDIPSKGRLKFEERTERLRKLFPLAPIHKIGGKITDSEKSNITLLDHVACTGPEHLHQLLKQVQSVGGEGLMLRLKESKYEHKRSATLQKVKTFYDAEAEVVGYEPGKGKYSILTGALTCRMACGLKFSVGSGLTDEQRRKPPHLGAIITYRFQELSKDGVPRFATFVGEAVDKDEPKDAEIRKVTEAESDVET